MKIQLSESGYEFDLNVAEYEAACREAGCDSPTDWGISYEAATWVSAGYAASDPAWDVPEGWPENLPLWEQSR